MGDGVPPEGGLGGRVVDSPVVLGLCPPIPIAFDDPHQLHSYPRLHVHLPSSRRVVARSGRLDSARRGSGSCRVRLPFGYQLGLSGHFVYNCRHFRATRTHDNSIARDAGKRS